MYFWIDGGGGDGSNLAPCKGKNGWGGHTSNQNVERSERGSGLPHYSGQERRGINIVRSTMVQMRYELGSQAVSLLSRPCPHWF